MSNETHNDAKDMSFADMVDGMLVVTAGPVIGATLCPGITVCVPGLVLFGAAIAVPIVVLAAVGLLLGAMTALPYLVVRTSVRLLRRRSRPRRGDSLRSGQLAGPG